MIWVLLIWVLIISVSGFNFVVFVLSLLFRYLMQLMRVLIVFVLGLIVLLGLGLFVTFRELPQQAPNSFFFSWYFCHCLGFLERLKCTDPSLP
jgi:hypothetical protein